MPLYEYQCDACGHRFEVIRKFSDPPVETCPACGGAVHKLMSSPAFQFKGSGWYITDYARKEQAPGAKPEEGAQSAAAGDDKSEKVEKTAKTDTTDQPGKSDKTQKSDVSGAKSEAQT